MITRDILLKEGFAEMDFFYTKGTTQILECNGSWYQIIIDPSTLQSEQRPINSLEDITDSFLPLKDKTPVDKKKVPHSAGKPPLPSYIIKKSDKWWFNTETKKYIIADKIKSMYSI